MVQCNKWFAKIQCKVGIHGPIPIQSKNNGRLNGEVHGQNGLFNLDLRKSTFASEHPNDATTNDGAKRNDDVTKYESYGLPEYD